MLLYSSENDCILDTIKVIMQSDLELCENECDCSHCNYVTEGIAGKQNNDYRSLVVWQQEVSPCSLFGPLTIALVSLKASTLKGSLLPRTSILGFAVKNELGLNETISVSAGIL